MRLFSDTIKNIDSIEFQLKAPKYNETELIDDYMNIFTYFGYMTLFVVALPISTIVVAVSVYTNN